MRGQTQAEVEAYKDKARGYLNEAEEAATSHPWLTLVAGLGLGVALGISSPSLGGRHNGGTAASNGPPEQKDDGESVVSRGLGLLLGAAAEPLMNEVRDQLSGPIEEIKSTVQQSVSQLVHEITGTGDGTDHRQKVRDHVAA